MKNKANILLEIHLKELGIEFECEYKFHARRKWRFDYLLSDPHVIEIEGGTWISGRHNRGKGFLADMEKYREAAAMGYKVYRFSTEEVMNGTAKKFIQEHCL